MSGNSRKINSVTRIVIFVSFFVFLDFSCFFEFDGRVLFWKLS